MTFLCLAITTHADPYWKVFDGLVYSIDGDPQTATVCAASDYTKDATYDAGTSGELVYQGEIVIPATIPNPDNAEQPFKVIAINADAFSNNTAITSITINSEITAIPDNCFKGCTGLTSISFGEEVTTITTIGNNAFEGCKELVSIAIPNSVTTIGNNAFQDCTLLGSIAIPNGVTTINAYTFYNCSGMTEVSIPESVTTINKDAFLGCSSLQKVTFASIQQLCSINFENKNANPFSGADPNKIDAHHLYIYNDETSVEEVIKDINLTGVTEIKQYAFSECWGLTSIYIPASVKTIRKNAFDFEEGKKAKKSFPKTSFESIESLCKTNFETKESTPIYYQNDVYIGTEATAMTTIDIPSASLKEDGYLGANILANASKIVTVSIPEGTKSIGENAFYECKSLQVANYFKLEYVNGISYANQYSNPLRYASVLKVDNKDQSELKINYSVKGEEFANQKWLKKVIFQEGVTSIGKDAFNKCINLTTVVFDEAKNLNTIGDGAFWGCTNLTSVTLPESLQSLGREAFRYCRGIKDITIPAACGTLGTFVFDNCSGLTKVEVKSSVNIIPNGFFSGCDHLKEITWPAVTTIGSSAFIKCSALTVFPTFDNLNTIQNNAFELCSGLTNLVLPEKVVYINESAFASCKSITSLTIPNPVENRIDILSNAFDKCTSLTQVYSFIEDPTINTINVRDNAFGDRASLITLFVPIGSKDLYATKEPWKSFKAPIQEMNGNTVTLSFYVNDVEQKEMAITKQPGLAIGASDMQTIDNALTDLLGDNDEFSGWDQEIPKSMPNDNMDFHGYISYVREIDGFKWHLYPAETHPTEKGSRAVLISITEQLANDDNTIRIGIKIPSNVTYNSVVYPVKVIASRAFNANDIKGCERIPSVTLHNGLEMIESAVFDGCSAIKQVLDFPNKLTVISDYLFSRCKSLETFKVYGENTNGLPTSITEIGREAFKNCSNFDLKTLPTSLERIGYQAFYGSGMTSISFEKDLTLDTDIFSECKYLKTVDFGSYGLAVPDRTFLGCTKLENVALHNVNSINQSAFKGCTSLASITFPTLVGFIGNFAFNGCENLLQIKMENSEPGSIEAANETIFDENTYKNATLYVPVGSENAFENENYIWHKFQNKIESEVCKLYYELDGTVIKSLDVNAGAAIVPEADPDGDYNKEGRDFSGWKNEPKVMPKEDVTVKGALKYKVTYQDNVGEAINNAEGTLEGEFFYDDNIVIPVEDLNDPGHKFTITFKDFKKKDNGNGEEGYEDLIVTQDDVQDEVATTMLKMPAKDITAIVNYAQSEAETDYKGIKYRIVDMNTANPHAELIDGSQAEGNVDIPSTIDYEGVDIPVTVIGDRVFKDNRKLTRISIPESIVEMGTENFAHCFKLESFAIAEKIKIKTLPNLTFIDCGSLQGAELPEGFRTIGDRAFSKCSLLNKVILPSTLDSIGDRAFSECKLLKEVTLPPNLKFIGEYAFDRALGENATLTIHKEAKELPKAQENTFDGTTLDNGTTLKTNLVVDDSPWTEFKTIELVSDEGGSGLVKCEDPSITYDNKNKKLVFTCSTQGATIVYKITVADNKRGEVTSEEVTSLERKYVVTAYARKTGLMPSSTVTLALPWYSKGDVNDDGIVTVADAVEVIKLVVVEPTSNE